MKKLFNLLKQNALSIVIMAVLVGITVWGLQQPQPQQKIYNCEMAEFHPDYPVKAREACRKLRREHNESGK